MTTSDRKLKLKLAQLVRCNGFTVYVNGAWEMNAATRRKAWRSSVAISILEAQALMAFAIILYLEIYFYIRNLRSKWRRLLLPREPPLRGVGFVDIKFCFHG